MVIRDLCSFDALATADLSSRFTLNTSSTIVAAAGRGGTAALRMASAFGALTRSGLPQHATYGVAFSFKTSILGGSTGTMVLALLDSTTGSPEQISLNIDSAGRIVIKRGSSGGTQLGSISSPVIFTGVQHHLQFMATISDTVGVYEARVDGATVVSGSGADTKATTNAFVDGYALGGIGSGNNDFDDLYVWDGSGSVNTGFPGDVRVLSSLPSGAGASTGWTPSTGANYAAVDDATPNTSDYVAGDGTDKDTYAFADIVGSGTVRGALLSAYATKVDAGPARGIKGVCRNGGTETLSAEVALGIGYRYWLLSIFEQDPATAAAWATLAALNSAEWGVSVST